MIGRNLVINKVFFASILFDLVSYSQSLGTSIHTQKSFRSCANVIHLLWEGLEVPLEEGSNLSEVGLPIFLWALKMFALFP